MIGISYLKVTLIKYLRINDLVLKDLLNKDIHFLNYIIKMMKYFTFKLKKNFKRKIIIASGG